MTVHRRDNIVYMKHVQKFKQSSSYLDSMRFHIKVKLQLHANPHKEMEQLHTVHRHIHVLQCTTLGQEILQLQCKTLIHEHL